MLYPPYWKEEIHFLLSQERKQQSNAKIVECNLRFDSAYVSFPCNLTTKATNCAPYNKPGVLILAKDGMKGYAAKVGSTIKRDLKEQTDREREQTEA
jgi:hypothetical protein